MTDEQIAEQINEALAAVNSSQAEGEFKLTAFEIVLGRLLSQAAPQAPGASHNEASPIEDTGTEEWQQRIARKLGVTSEQVTAIFLKEDDESLRLILNTSVLPKNKQTATQDIAKLLATGRVAAGMDEAGTQADVIRAEAEYYGRLDSNNFSRALRNLKPNFHYDGGEKTLTPRAPGYADAKEVVNKYVSEEE